MSPHHRQFQRHPDEVGRQITRLNQQLVGMILMGEDTRAGAHRLSVSVLNTQEIADGVDYELNLMMMDNFEIESSDYDSLQSDSDIEESRTGGKLRRGLTRKKSVLDRKKSTLEESNKKKTEQLGTL